MGCSALSTYLVHETQPKCASIQWLKIEASIVTLPFGLSLQVKLLHLYLHFNKSIHGA